MFSLENTATEWIEWTVELANFKTFFSSNSSIFSNPSIFWISPNRCKVAKKCSSNRFMQNSVTETVIHLLRETFLLLEI